MTLAPGTEQLLQIFIIIAGVLLIPIGVGLLVVIFKLAFLIHSVSEFCAMASYELTPLIRELRQTVGHLETIGEKAAAGIRGLTEALRQAGPWVKNGFSQLKENTSALASGLNRSFGP